MTTYTHSQEIEDLDDFSFEVEVDLNCTAFGEKPSGMSGPPEFYDPGSGPEFEVDAIRVNGVELTEEQFVSLFDQDTIDRAVETAETKAAESGEFG